MRYLILVVIFNLRLSESKSIQSLVKCRDMLLNSKMVIWDNSYIQSKELMFIDKMFNNVSFEYKHTPENLPLSVIYNLIRSEIKYHDNFDYIIILDQDSIFEKNFFYAHENAIKKSKFVNLYLPLIMYKGKIVSPAYFIYFKGFLFKERKIGIVKSKFKTAINSCMIIDSYFFFKKFKGYDERLRFYGTDDDFMNKYKIDNEFFVILDYEVEHNLTFSFKNEKIENILSRYKEANFAFKINCNANNRLLVSILLNLYLICRGLFLSVKFKNYKFLYI